MRCHFMAAAGCVMFLVSSAALAQDGALSGFYARLEGGVSFPEKLTQDLTFNPSVAFPIAPPATQTVDARTGYAAGGAIGRRLGNGFKAELEYRFQSSKIDSVVLNGGAVVSGPIFPNVSLAAHFLMPNLIYEFRNSSPLTPFIGVGVGGARIRSSLGAGNAADTDFTLAYQGRAGLAFAVGEATRLGVEYVYVRSGELHYGPRNFTPTGSIGPQISGASFAASTVLISFEKAF
ncbi:MAG TPA: outer membrane beta-barrel protein [Parvularculaceae bacterium]|nr:outer membrane beta-barrel protein [Parvularculaceae bacterium]